jgi:hypothetical protein
MVALPAGHCDQPIGFAAAGAFGVVTFALNNNWL